MSGRAQKALAAALAGNKRVRLDADVNERTAELHEAGNDAAPPPPVGTPSPLRAASSQAVPSRHPSSQGLRADVRAVTGRALRLWDASVQTLGLEADKKSDGGAHTAAAPPAVARYHVPRGAAGGTEVALFASTSPAPPPLSRAEARRKLAAVRAAATAGLLEPPGLRALLETVRLVFVAGDGVGRHSVALPAVAEAVRRAAPIKSHATDGECAPSCCALVPAARVRPSLCVRVCLPPPPSQRILSATLPSCRLRQGGGWSFAASPRRAPF